MMIGGFSVFVVCPCFVPRRAPCLTVLSLKSFPLSNLFIAYVFYFTDREIYVQLASIARQRTIQNLVSICIHVRI